MSDKNVNMLYLNKKIYNAIAPLYEERHSEIFNTVEQNRINAAVKSALENVQTGSDIPRVLDFGAGTGNLTRHFLDLGVAVVASDVSSGCLKELKLSFRDAARLELSLLNGHDLSQFAEGTFDMVATYSVLHHVPDYLAAVSEFVRVVKPGGIVYIDHEVCPAYWENKPEYQMYCREIPAFQPARRDSFFKRVLYIFKQKCWWRYLSSAIWVRWNKVTDEGDIHVLPDDHIEWQEIRRLLESCCEILQEQDYLVCRERTFPAPVWERWNSSCVDMRMIIARKRQ